MTGGAGALEVMLTQRGCRSFTDEPVDEEALRTMLEAATHAPSAENRQPWGFVVVRAAATRGAIADLTRELWAAGARAHSEGRLSPGLLAAVDAFVETGYGGAPVLIVVAGDGRDGTPPAVLASSVLPATQNLLLAAAALGYGSSMTTLAAQAPDRLAALVGLPDGVRPFAVVPVGRPAAPLGPPRRRPVHEVAHLERFGDPFPPISPGRREPDGPPLPPPPPA